MRPRTALVLALLLLGATGAAFVGITTDRGGSLSTDWVSETARPDQVNHHPVVAERIDGEAFVAAPVSTVSAQEADCTLVQLDGNGTARWHYSIDDAACATHGLGDPAFADSDGDGTPEVLVATTENRLYGFDARTGAVELTFPLASFGYSQPAAVTTPDHRALVADFYGNVFAVAPNGSVAWNYSMGTVVVSDLVVDDFVGDATPEIAVGGSKRLALLTPNGSVVWSRNVSAQFLVSARVDGAPRLFASKGETVAALDSNGSVLWRVKTGMRPALHGVVDGDGDDDPEIYVAVRGHVLALDARTGEVAWQTTLVPDTLVFAPVAGDLDGNGAPELVATSNDGSVWVLDAASGNVLASHSRDVKIWTHATVSDYDGDGDDEILVMYGDGRVVSFSYRAS